MEDTPTILERPIATPTLATPTNESLIQEQLEREGRHSYQEMLVYYC